MEKILPVYIDCRSDKGDTNDFYTLSMWGKPCFEYVCDMVADTDVFVRKYLLTDSKKVKALASKYNMEVKEQLPDDNTPKMIISGKAIFLTKNTLTEVAAAYKGGNCCQFVRRLI